MTILMTIANKKINFQFLKKEKKGKLLKSVW